MINSIGKSAAVALNKRWLAAVLSVCVVGPSFADDPDVISVRRMSLELARDIAQGAVFACRKMGYQVTAAVVDRNGNAQVVMRDVHASRFTMQIAEDKANAVILSGIASGEFRDNRPDIRNELNHVGGVLMMQGGLPIRAAGSLVGAVGVSGAPGGDKDEACAQQALDKVRDRLEFAD
jgi:uncharacterized protein GlcG (DUF336 family)